MSDILGYERGVRYSNDSLMRNIALQNAIQNRNLENLTNHNVVEKQNEVLKKVESDKAQEGGTAEAGSFLNDARNIYKTGKQLNKIYDDTGKAVRGARRGAFLRGGDQASLEGMGDVRVGDAPRELDLGQDTSDVVDDTRFARGGSAVSRGADLSGQLNYGRSALEQTLQGSARGVGEAFTGTRETIGAVGEGVRSAQMGDMSGIMENTAKAINSTKNVMKSLDSLGKAGEGLAVVSGVSDVLDDADGGFNKLNTAEKVSNVAGITAGATGLASLTSGLETTGAMLDATGIGAEIGVGLQVAGGVASGIGAIADYVGSKMKQGNQVKIPASSTMTPQTSLMNAPKISAVQVGGVASSQPY